MKKLIINADDFGFNTNINRGIIDAAKNGVVTSVSLMVTKEAFEEAVQLLNENPWLANGIHIDLDQFFAIDHERGIATGWLDQQRPLQKVATEIERQIITFLEKGLTPDHLSGHHQVHLQTEIFPIVCELCAKYNIRGIRFYRKFYSTEDEFNKMKEFVNKYKLVYPPHFIEGWYWGNIDEEYNIAELMTHPGYGELWREYELSACRNPELKKILREKDIQLVTYAELIKSA